MSVTIDGKTAFPKRYLKAADLGGKDVSLTVASVSIEALRDTRTGGEKDKYIIRFVELADREGSERPHLFVCNETNAGLIAEATGKNEMLQWNGERITLYPTRVKVGREMKDAIRVRPTKPTARRNGAQEKAEPPPEQELPPLEDSLAQYGESGAF